MPEFDALTRPAYALLPTSLPTSFRVTLDGVEMASLYLDTEDQEWALAADDRIAALPAPFGFYACHTFPTWREMTAFLGIDAPRPVDPAANTVEDIVDIALRKAGRTTYGEIRAELARWNDTAGARLESQLVGACVAENRRLRTGIGLIAAGIGSAIAASAMGDGETSVNLLVRAKGAADRLSAFDRHETLPADVPILAHVRAERQATGGRAL